MLDTKERSETLTRSLAQQFVERGKLNAASLDRALHLQEETHERLDIILTKLGLISDRDMAEAFSSELNLPLVEASDYPEEALLAERISANFLKEHKVLPISESAEGLVLAMADPLDSYAREAIRLLVDKPVVPCVAVPSEVEAAFERLYGAGRTSLGQIIDDVAFDDREGAAEDIERLKDLASEAPVIRMVNAMISNAVNNRASDIHVEPQERALRVRYRIDGALRPMETPPNQFRAAIISRIKLMAKLNIAETRLPQDGRIKLAVHGKEIDLRVSTMPTMHGESVVIRVLDRDSVALKFPALGFGEDDLKIFLDILNRPHGVLLVTGPTGSGKTTTLYTSLVHLNTNERKILTVEDPIEYQLEGIDQVQVKRQVGLTFANALRSLLRHDPDVIMIGEIRDLETAEIGVQAALTGHIVLSTLHTNDAASSITRLLDMGVKDYLLVSTINGVVAQRLVRKLCVHCRKPHEILPELAHQLGIERFLQNGRLSGYQAVGCDKCGGTGYAGRTGIIEILPMTDEIRRCVLTNAGSNDIKRAAVAQGMRTMFEDGVRKALAGVTTIEEVLRTTRDT